MRWHCSAKVKILETREDSYQLILGNEMRLDYELAILTDSGRSGLHEQPGIAAKQAPYR